MAQIKPGKLSPPTRDEKFEPTKTWKNIKDFLFLAQAAINSLLNANNRQEVGTATFAAATTVAIVFANAQLDTNYKILLGPGGNLVYWATAKTLTGFTLNAASSTSTSVDWHITR